MDEHVTGVPEPGPELAQSPHVIRLLEFDPDLGSELDAEALAQARHQVLLPAVTLATGPWDADVLAAAAGVQGTVYGFVLVAGMLTFDVDLAGRASTRLLTPPELVLLDRWQSETLPLRWGWTALERSIVGVLDARLLTIGRRWPGLMAAILVRSAEQVRHALLQQAIAQIPRVEERLMALMWEVADRRGVVREDGIWVRLPVTHDTLARMIGARRPTVSLGLKALSARGMLVADADGDGWLINRGSLDELIGARPGAHRARRGRG
jgi:CRP/FNR family transcriptional regulator, cyclic AMP receptor protein